jgi:hypothetical protein
MSRRSVSTTGVRSAQRAGKRIVDAHKDAGMDITAQLLASWRAAEAAVEVAQPGTAARRIAELRAELAKAAYRAHVDGVFEELVHSEDDSLAADHQSGAWPHQTRAAAGGAPR